jgi:hypothetical protein
MTEHQTRIVLTYRETMKARVAMRFTRNMAKVKVRDEDYKDAYLVAMAGRDRFAFTRATRRYLKALRALAAEGVSK